MYDLKSRKTRVLLLVPPFIVLISSFLFLAGTSEYPIGVATGFCFGWLGALVVVYIPIELEERKKLERKRHEILKELHQIIGEHHKKRNGIEL